MSKFEDGLERNSANYVPLSPLSFLARTALVHPHLPSVVHGDRRFTWAETYERCRRLASGLSQRGVGPGDTVAVLLPNTPAMYEVHFAVPMAGAVLNALNIRLDAEALAFMLVHGEAKVLLVDVEFADLAREALAKIAGTKPLVIDVDDDSFGPPNRIGAFEYEDLLNQGDAAFPGLLPLDEWDAISLNYTSGTTGNPKGVVYHHRGAYLNAVSNCLSGGLSQHPVYLWTLPMFHCNGWCFPWTLAALAGVNICLRRVEAARIFELIRREGVTHMCGAPIVYNLLVNSAETLQEGKSVKGLVAGAPPPVAVITGAERKGIHLTHVYGLTEVYGPAAVCESQPEWADLPLEERARLNRRQGVPYHLQSNCSVRDPQTLCATPFDGTTLGEIMFRGNIVMKGYLKNRAATEEAFAGGWFHTGDLGVVDQDGYILLKDRSKDIIISGGENISSVEIEDVLYSHPSILCAAVVATPDAKWGEVPCAFIELKPGTSAGAAEIISYCQNHLARFKVPKQIVFGVIPKTSTGKVQKFALRQQAGSAMAISKR